MEVFRGGSVILADVVLYRRMCLHPLLLENQGLSGALVGVRSVGLDMANNISTFYPRR